VAGCGSTGEYFLVDLTAQTGETYTYRLIEEEIWGSQREYGPWTQTIGVAEQGPGQGWLKRSSAATSWPKGARFTPWQSTTRGFFVRKREISFQASDQGGGQGGGQGGKKPPKGGDAEISALRFHTVEAGLYRVPETALSLFEGGKGKKGSLADKLESGALALTSGGQAVSYFYDPVDEAIYFAAEAYRSRDTMTNVYNFADEDGVAMPLQSGDGPVPADPGSFTEVVQFEQNNLFDDFWHNDEDGDFGYWALERTEFYTLYGYLIPPYVLEGDVTVRLNGVSATGQLTLRVWLRGGTNRAVGNDHRVTAQVVANGEDLNGGDPLPGEAVWDGQNMAMLELNIDQASLPPADASGEIELTITLLGETLSSSFSYILLDRIEAEYQRDTRAADDQLRVRDAQPGVLTVEGFSNDGVRVMATTGPAEAVWRQDVTVDLMPDGTYSASVEVADPADFLFSAAPLEPEIQDNLASDLRGSGAGAEYLIIAPAALMDGAQALSEYRSGDFVTEIVRAQDIYDEFADGRTESLAIEQFLEHAHANWVVVPTYVVLLGRGTMDHKDELGYGESLIPLRMAQTPWGLAASDLRYADVNGDRIPDFRMGRIAASDVATVMDYVDKLRAYEALAPWSNTPALLADNPDSAGEFHVNSDVLYQMLLVAGYGPERLYHPVDEYTDEDGQTVTVGDQLVAGWAAGDYLYVNYDGHGSKTDLGQEEFLAVEDVETLNNGDYLPIFAALTCAAGNSAYPGILSLADTLVLHETGGAIAAFAPSGASLDEFAHAMNVELVQALLIEGRSLGSAAKAAQQADLPEFMRDIYLNLGDPAVRAAR
jgi:hypothetical protein